ncbi:MAG TPA: ABC transporter permease [Candidatus Saccharimonadales bacterium]|nr:ABC transporter permease [Candidatus Saccharimonadales bacterium]
MKYLNVKNRAILREMVVTDFKVRYQGSVLGYVWSLLKPLLLFAVLYILFTYIAPIGKGVPHYGVELLVGIVLWNFFSETTMVGASSVVANGELIRKISIPRYLVVIASSVSALINLSLSFIIIVIFAFANGVTFSASWLLLPLIVIELFVFSVGIAFILATAYVKYRDVTYIWEVVLQAGFYASAVIVPMSVVPKQLHDWFFMNPLVQMIQDARNLLVPSANNITIWNTVDKIPFKLVPFLLIALLCIIGFIYFKRQSKYFAEDI